MRSVITAGRFVTAAILLTILSGCIELIESCDSSDHRHDHHHHRGHDDHRQSVDRQLVGATITTVVEAATAVVATGAEQCGFDMPSDEEIAEDTAKMIEWQRIEDMTPPWIRSDRTYSIPTYFHVIQTSTTTGIITDSRIQDMINYLNNAFTNSAVPFVFEKMQVTRTVRSDWAKCNDKTIETQIKTSLKVGNGDTLNVYICPPMFTEKGASLTGFATGPSSNSWTSIMDGVVINNDTSEGRLNTLVHEVGHFLGLFHTFGDNTCNANSLGDRVDDTPQHISYASTVNCNSDPSTWDTCPALPGLDPNDNYMNYSNSLLCRTRFTAGQSTRMVAQYELYRRQAPTSAPVNPPPPPIPRPIPAPVTPPRRPSTAAPRRPTTAAPRRPPTKVPSVLASPFAPLFAQLPIEQPTTSTSSNSCFFTKCGTESKCCAGNTCRLNRGLLGIMFGGRCLPF